MNNETIVIMELPTNPKSSLYYHQGNFYHQLDLPGNLLGKVRGAIRRFMKDNKEMVERDRADPNYKTILEIFDKQMEGK